jgi:hypothetical protein
MQVFGGLVYAGNPKLPGSEIAINEYPLQFDSLSFITVCLLAETCFIPSLGLWVLWYALAALASEKWVCMCKRNKDLTTYSYMVNNFNDFPSGMVTLFNILVLGNWQVWMDVCSHFHPAEFLVCSSKYLSST